jgi:uncharacterized protein YdbL (DUF1318 family)
MFRVAAALILLLSAALAGAASLDLDQAKREGWVGETLEGYVAVVDGVAAPAEVHALVEDVNARRRDEYRRIARDNGIELEQVEALAAKKAIDRTRSGGWVRLNGEWQQK